MLVTDMNDNNVIYGINGPVVTVKGTKSFSMMEMVYVGKERLIGEIIGVTDELTTIQVYEETTGCKLADHSALAGSVATMDRLIRTVVQKAEIPLEDAVRMASETPARIMGVYDRKGSLQKGKDADILVLDEDLNVRAVWAMGKLVPETNTLF